MKYKSYSVYDNDDFFQRYIQRRNTGTAPNDTLEKPIIDELISDIEGKNVLDLGCGDGNYGIELLEKGASHYHGIDGSINMVNLAAENLEGFHADIEQHDIETAKLKANNYDIVLSRLVLHYVEHLEILMEKIEGSLRKGGIFVCSIEHPIITSCFDSYHDGVKRNNWLVDDYFSSGERTNKWINKEVIKYHKTVEEYFKLFKNAGFKIADIRESKPQRSYFTEEKEYQRRMKIPVFMIFKLEKK